MGVEWTSLRAWPISSSSVLNSIGDGASIRFLSSWIRFPLVIRSMTDDTCFFILEVSLATSNVIGVAPWFSFPTLAKEVRSKNVNAASVVSSQPWKIKFTYWFAILYNFKKKHILTKRIILFIICFMQGLAVLLPNYVVTLSMYY